MKKQDELKNLDFILESENIKITLSNNSFYKSDSNLFVNNEISSSEKIKKIIESIPEKKKINKFLKNEAESSTSEESNSDGEFDVDASDSDDELDSNNIQELSIEEIYEKELENIVEIEKNNDEKDVFKENLTEDEKKTYYLIFNGLSNAMEKAKELYDSVNNESCKNGYLYKMRDKADFLGIHKKVVNLIFSEANKIENLDELNNFMEEFLEKNKNNKNYKIIEDVVNKLNSIGLIEDLKEIGKLMGEKKDKVLEIYEENVENIIYEIAKSKYFGVDGDKVKSADLENNGNIYNPGVIHTWPVNLAWIMAHLKKGNEFMVVSDVIKNKYRGTEILEMKKDIMNSLTKTYNNKEDKEYSAFIREVCCCLKANYKLEYDGQKTTLSPTAEWKPENCVSNGLRGNGINPDGPEMDIVHEQLKEGYDSKKPFTYTAAKGLDYGENNLSFKN